MFRYLKLFWATFLMVAFNGYALVFFSVSTGAQDRPLETVSADTATIQERVEIETRFAKFLEGRKVVGLRTRVENQSIVPRSPESGPQYDTIFGTGFLIKENIVATVNHLIRDSQVTEANAGKGWKRATLFGRIHTRDISFFKVKDGFAGDIITETRSIKTVFASFPQDTKQIPLSQLLVGVRCVIGDHSRVLIGELVRLYVSTGMFDFIISGDAQGCSGAPVFAYDGAVVGILQSGSGVSIRAFDIEQVFEALHAFEATEKK